MAEAQETVASEAARADSLQQELECQRIQTVTDSKSVYDIHSPGRPLLRSPGRAGEGG